MLEKNPTSTKNKINMTLFIYFLSPAFSSLPFQKQIAFFPPQAAMSA